MQSVIWLGSSERDWKDFPDAAQDDLGFQLHLVQCGLEPMDWKPMKNVGEGVCELRYKDESGAFRVIYLAARSEGVYVIHAFQKKTQRTSKKDLDLARTRLKRI